MRSNLDPELSPRIITSFRREEVKGIDKQDVPAKARRKYEHSWSSLFFFSDGLVFSGVTDMIKRWSY